MVNLFGFWVLVKKRGCLEINKLKCKIELLKVLGHWGWIPRATEGFQCPFLALGRITYSHFPNQIFM